MQDIFEIREDYFVFIQVDDTIVLQWVHVVFNQMSQSVDIA